jgi:hypothetical protein
MAQRKSNKNLLQEFCKKQRIMAKLGLGYPQLELAWQNASRYLNFIKSRWAHSRYLPLVLPNRFLLHHEHLFIIQTQITMFITEKIGVTMFGGIKVRMEIEIEAIP